MYPSSNMFQDHLFSGHKQHNTASWGHECGEQDSNLRTVEDCDLNAAPLTKLGDPRVERTLCHSVIKSPLGLFLGKNRRDQRRKSGAVRFG